ncbi:MAG: hypothetical protein Q9160_006313 [Pyrenula sp. 1 TL-2023]
METSPLSDYHEMKHEFTVIQEGLNPIKEPIASRRYLGTLPTELRDMIFEGMPWMALAALSRTNRSFRRQVRDFKECKSVALRQGEDDLLEECELDLFLSLPIIQSSGGVLRRTVLSSVDDVVPGSVLADIVLRQRQPKSLPCYNCLEDLHIDRFLPISATRVPTILLTRRCIDCRIRTHVFDDAWDHENGFYIIEIQFDLFRWHGACIECNEPRLFIRRYNEGEYGDGEPEAPFVPWASPCRDCRISRWERSKELWSKGRPEGMTEAEWTKTKKVYVERRHAFHELAKLDRFRETADGHIFPGAS